MATKELNGTPSKSDAVREYLSSHATAPVKEIGKALSEQGVDVSIALINKIKYNDRKSSGHRQRGRRGRVGASRAKGTTKAQAIRDTLTHLGRSARPRDVIAHLKAGGIIVSAAQVSAVRKSFRKHARLKQAVAGSPLRANADLEISVEHLFAAKRLADQLGLDAAKRALDFLVKLSP